MNGAHDLGGMMGFGPIEEIAHPIRYHAPWERRALGLTLAMGATGAWSIDHSRAMRESLPPPEYLTSTYYQIWIKGLEKLVAARGLVTPEELREGRAKEAPKTVPRVLRESEVAAVLAKGAPCDRAPSRPATFAVGDRVRAKTINPPGHTRLPRYVRGHVGRIEIVHGVHVYPDTNAADQGEQPDWLYCVRFEARELWGDTAHPADSISVDAFERYLDHV